VRNISYLVPISAIALLAWLGKPSWWAIALVCGGAKFAWDWLWGDLRLLQARYGLRLTGIGLLLVIAAYLLALGLGMGLSEFQATAKGLPKREAFIYNLPAVGIGLFVYGLLIWSRAPAVDQGL
jgi:hypothetical protein